MINLTRHEALTRGETVGCRYRLLLPQAALRGRDGVRLGTATGTSLDFHDYRDYHPGDDLRHLDWSVYARSDRQVIKLFREEVAPHLDLIIDVTGSMDLANGVKSTAAIYLAAACAAAATQAGCSRTIWLAGQQLKTLPDSGAAPQLWPSFAFNATIAPVAALIHGGQRWRRHGVRIFISDLLWPDDPLPLINRLADGAAALTVIQLLTHDEQDPQPEGACRLQDVESGDYADLLINENACNAYRTALARHREGWSAACRMHGASFVAVEAEQTLQSSRLIPLERCQLLAPI
jgi:uncharacterized protein (DUF58 family)